MDNNLSNQEIVKCKRYWKNLFLKISDEAPLLFSNHTPESDNYSYIKKEFTLESVISNKIKHLSNNSYNLVYIIILSALYNLINSYYGNNQVCIGTPSTKNKSDNEILPVIIDFDNINDFKSLLMNVRDELNNVYRYQMYPIKNIFDNEESIVDVTRLYNIIVKHSSIHTEYKKYNCDTILEIKNIEDNIVLVWESNISETYIENLNKYLVTSLKQGLDDVSKNLSEYELIIDEEERNKFLIEIQGEKGAFPKDKHIIELFEQAVKNYPNNIALKFLEYDFTYLEMSNYINRLAQMLYSRGIRKNDRVAIFANRTPETIVSIYAILKIGASYLPIEPDYPFERIDHMITDSGSKLMIVPKNIRDYPQVDVECITISLKELENSKLPQYTNTPESDSLCYVIYTSGTTGKPKGVEIYNEGLVNLCSWFIKEMNIKENSKVILLNAFGFDASVKNVFAPLIVGSTLVLGPEFLFDTEKVLEIVERFNVTHLNCVPSLFYALLDNDKQNNLKSLSKLKYIILGGEALESKPLYSWAKSSLQADIINVYGPTECTSVSTAFKLIKENILNNKPIPIGRPIDNKFVYVLDTYKRLCPTNIPGELYISGIGTAEKYISNTSGCLEAFQPDIFRPSLKMYRTGDIVKWNENGLLEFIGRNDYQVKINGNRIELSEIESVINNYSSIKKSVVLLDNKNNGKQSLIGFALCSDENEPTELQIKEFIADYLPDYMIPSQIVICNKFPVTVHGKTDKNKLLKLVENSVNKVSLKHTNATYTQKELEEIWKQLLEVDYVDYDKNFFEAGGYSLLLYKLSKMIEERFSITVPFMDLMTYTTINLLAERIEEIKSIRDETENIGEIDAKMIEQNFMRKNRLAKIREKHNQEV